MDWSASEVERKDVADDLRRYADRMSSKFDDKKRAHRKVADDVDPRPAATEANVLAKIEELAKKSRDGTADFSDLIDFWGDPRADQVEAHVTTLMDRGRVFEPVLGQLRPTDDEA